MMKFNFDSVFKEMMKSHDLDTVVILGHLTWMGMRQGP